VDGRDLTLSSVFIGTPDGGVQALNGNGTLRWRFPLDGTSLGGPFTSTPALGLDAVYVATPGGILHALDAAGRALWGAPFSVEADSSALQPSPSTALSIYLPNADGQAIAYNVDGSLRWRFSAERAPTDPAPAVVGSLGVASQLIQDPDSTSSSFETIVYALFENGILYGLRDSGGAVVQLPRCSETNISCTIDSCPVGQGPCVSGKCSNTVDDVSCSAQSCEGDDGTCVLKTGRVQILPEGVAASTSPSISGDLFALVGTQIGSVCARRLDDETPEDWGENGCVEVGTDLPITDSPVVDSRARVFVVSNSSLYAIQ
jgi:hypothetical protein